LDKAGVQAGVHHQKARLGLTVVKRIVENYHRGRIFVLESKADVGTTFRVTLPTG
jgi:signal transduction histidine kinase